MRLRLRFPLCAESLKYLAIRVILRHSLPVMEGEIVETPRLGVPLIGGTFEMFNGLRLVFSDAISVAEAVAMRYLAPGVPWTPESLKYPAAFVAFTGTPLPSRKSWP
jgi:hypothetical protein